MGNIKTWVVTGDCHGDMSRFKNYTYPRDNTTGIIILGDSGVNYYLSEYDRRAKHDLQKSNYQYYLVRGNHEARPQDCGDKVIWEFDEKVNQIVGIDKEFPAIHYLLDGFTYYFGGHKTLVIGGAYSVDKYYRIMRGFPYLWFENEQLTEKEMKTIFSEVKNQTYDYVFTHTCPLKWEPTDLFIGGIDQSKVDKSMEKWLDSIEKNITYKIWLFGHYHADRTERKNVEQFFLTDRTLDDLWVKWNKGV